MKTLFAAVTMMVMVAAAPSVTGTWTLAVEGGPHGNAAMGLTLKQEGTKVTGTFASGHSDDLPVTGTFADGALKVETPGDTDKIIFNAKMKDDGTLAGFLSSPMGDMKWTAHRADAKDKKDQR